MISRHFEGGNLAIDLLYWRRDVDQGVVVGRVVVVVVGLVVVARVVVARGVATRVKTLPSILVLRYSARSSRPIASFFVGSSGLRLKLRSR